VGPNWYRGVVSGGYPIRSFRQFLAKMYRFATIQNVTDRQDKQTTCRDIGSTFTKYGRPKISESFRDSAQLARLNYFSAQLIYGLAGIVAHVLQLLLQSPDTRCAFVTEASYRKTSNISRVPNTSRVSIKNRVSLVSIWCQLTTLIVILSGIIMTKPVEYV